VFRELTLLFSRKEAHIHEVFPAFVTLRYRLRLMRDDTDRVLHPALRIGAQAALTTLDKYMTIMEGSNVYWMATALCPWYKMDWFIRNEYLPNRLRNITQMIQRHIAQTIPPNATSSAETIPHIPTPTQPTSRWMCSPAQSTISPSSTPVADSVSAYLNSPPISKESVLQMGGILHYWVREKERGSPVARVALDILTAPASSVDAERAFSGGRMAVNYRQHRMSLSTFRAKMALGSWYGTPLLPNIDEVEHILNDWEDMEPEPVDL
ncbi:hypothetical protein FRC07_005355, partial [Ceratobasidium sp. 392]